MSKSTYLIVPESYLEVINENGKLKRGHALFSEAATFFKRFTPIGYVRDRIATPPAENYGDKVRLRVYYEQDRESLPEDHEYCAACAFAFESDEMSDHDGDLYCSSCYSDRFCECAECGRTVSRNDSIYCNSRDEDLCESCYEEHGEDISLVDYSENFEGVLDPGKEPRNGWTEFRAKGESNKVPCYGMELEINYGDDYYDHEIWKILKTRFYGGFWLVSDGSVCNGCEIVFAPHSLKSYEERGLKDALKELADKGYRSYESGQCGLHIHAPRPRDSQGEKIQAFFSANADRMRNFAKRSSERLQQWAKIPACSSDRGFRAYSGNVRALRPGKYWSVNPHGSTLEFRCFRGTLSYQRVFASLQFVDAIMAHASTTSIATMGCIEKSWLSFVQWIKYVKAYRHLVSYLEKEGLTAFRYISKRFPEQDTDDTDDIDEGYSDYDRGQIENRTVNL